MEDKKFECRFAPQKYVLVGPATGVVCECCFFATGDMSQHVNKKGACPNFMACKHVWYCLVKKKLHHTFKPDNVVISCMLDDKTCPLRVEDIVSQTMNWDPTKEFNNADSPKDHALHPDLVGKSFVQVYQEYLAENKELEPAKMRDFVTQAITDTMELEDLNRSLCSEWTAVKREIVDKEGGAVRPAGGPADLERAVERKIQEKINTGALYRREAVIAREDGIRKEYQNYVSPANLVSKFEEMVNDGELNSNDAFKAAIDRRIDAMVEDGELIRHAPI